MSSTSRWSLHVCAFDRDCRHHIGVCWRVNLNTPWWHLCVALRPTDRLVSADGTTRWVSFSKP